VTNGVRFVTNDRIDAMKPPAAVSNRGTGLDLCRARADSDVMTASRRLFARRPSAGTRTAFLLTAGVSTALGVFSTLLAYNYVTLFRERPQPFQVLLALNTSYWYSWAVLVPGILWMAQRFRFTRDTWRRAAVAHAVSVVVFTAAHAALAGGARVVILRLLAGRVVEWWSYFQEQFFFNFDFSMGTYWAVVGLSHAINFHREAQQRAVAEAELETRLVEARLKSLQQQLHPHFLFNTLHTISALMHRDRQAADDMLIRLSDLLRLSLDRTSRQHVSLKDEVDFLQKYLEIEQTRFGDRLRVHMDIDPATLDAAVPNLLLQPIVENAVKHGIAPKIGGGMIEVVSRRDGSDLRLVIRDNGVGVSTQELHAFKTGVGLSNTRARLEHLYRGAHRFECEDQPGGGLAVTIVIPFVQQQLESPGDTLMERLA
jgi:signal transduction histidine kinase